MRVLNVSLDTSIFKADSSFVKRVVAYRSIVDEYTVIVPSVNKQKVILIPGLEVYGSGGSNKIVRLWNMYAQATRILHKQAYDIITVQDPHYLGLVGWCLAQKYNCPLEVQVHGFEKENFWRLIIAKFVLKQATGIRVVSERLKKEIIATFGLDSSKIKVIPIHSSYSEVLQSEHDYHSHTPFTFLTVSRLVAVKNIQLQIKAVANVVQSHPDVVLKIVGAGPEKNNLSNLISRLGIASHVEFVGAVAVVDSYYQQADACMLTSNREGWGLVVIEAASFGLPIIMTDVGCAGEVIKDHDNGLVIPPGDERALVTAMKEIINNVSLREKIGRKAQATVQTLPTLTQTLTLYRQAWDGLL